jgi:DNA (cytosine-5)-methyltransferase 1
MTRPLCIDLFGGEGLAAYGYALAFEGRFRIVSVENDPERIANHVRHPDIEVVEADATTYPLDGATVVLGSPPCTDHTETARLAEATRGGAAGTGWMLEHTLRRVRAWALRTGGYYVIENVEGAKRHFRDPVKLCGTMLDLEDEGWWLQRHRYFESNAGLWAPGPCRHAGKRFISVHGDLSPNDRACGGKRRPGGDMRAGVPRARRLMGAPWASPRGLSLGLPVRYTMELGMQLIDHIDSGQGCE